jgi:hypothetical protein
MSRSIPRFRLSFESFVDRQKTVCPRNRLSTQLLVCIRVKLHQIYREIPRE